MEQFPFLSISDISSQNKCIKYTEKCISEEGLKNSSTWLVPKNSIILSMYASYGLLCINKIELATSQAMYSMIFQDDIDVEFIYYYLYYLQQINYYDRLVSTGTQSNLNAEKVKKSKKKKNKAQKSIGYSLTYKSQVVKYSKMK